MGRGGLGLPVPARPRNDALCAAARLEQPGLELFGVDALGLERRAQRAVECRQRVEEGDACVKLVGLCAH